MMDSIASIGGQAGEMPIMYSPRNLGAFSSCRALEPGESIKAEPTKWVNLEEFTKYRLTTSL